MIRLGLGLVGIGFMRSGRGTVRSVFSRRVTDKAWEAGAGWDRCICKCRRRVGYGKAWYRYSVAHGIKWKVRVRVRVRERATHSAQV